MAGPNHLLRRRGTGQGTQSGSAEQGNGSSNLQQIHQNFGNNSLRSMVQGGPVHPMLQDDMRMNAAGVLSEGQNRANSAMQRYLGGHSDLAQAPDVIQARLDAARRGEFDQVAPPPVQNGPALTTDEPAPEVAAAEQAEEAEKAEENPETATDGAQVGEGAEQDSTPNQVPIDPTSQENIEEQQDVSEKDQPPTPENSEEGPSIEPSPAPNQIEFPQPQVEIPSLNIPNISTPQMTLGGMEQSSQSPEQLQMLEMEKMQSEQIVASILAGKDGYIGQMMSNASTPLQNIQQAADAAKQQVQTAMTSQQAQIESQMAGALENIAARMAALRGNIDSIAGTLTSQITSQGEMLNTTIAQNFADGLSQIQEKQSAQKELIGQLYNGLDAQYNQLTNRMMSFIESQGQRRISGYNAEAARWDGVSQGLFTGCINHKKFKARAEAARAVTDAYKTQVRDSLRSKLAETKGMRPQDENAANQIAASLSQGLQTQQQQLSTQAQQGTQQSLQQVQQLQASLHQNINQTQAQLNAQVQSGREAMLSQVTTVGQDSLQAIDTVAARGTAQIQSGLVDASNQLGEAYAELASQLGGKEAPSVEGAQEAADLLQVQMDGAMSQMENALNESASQVIASIQSVSQTALNGFNSLGVACGNLSNDLVTQANSSAEQMQTGMDSASAQMRTGFDNFRSSTTQQSVELVNQGVQSLDSGYQEMSGRLQDGAASNLQQVESGYQSSVTNRIGNSITQEAEKAAAQVKPAWKSVVKWVLTIAVIIVAACVLGPLVAGFAVGLGASAAAATLISGVVVGAIAGGASGIIGNWYDNKPWHTGLFKNMAVGAVSGVIGFGTGAAISKHVSGALAQFGSNLIADVSVDMGIKAVLGEQITWDVLLSSVISTLVGSSIKAGIQMRAPGMGGLNDLQTTNRTRGQNLGVSAAGTDAGQNFMSSSFGQRLSTFDFMPANTNAPATSSPASAVDAPATDAPTSAAAIDASANAPTVQAPAVDAPATSSPASAVDAPTPQAPAADISAASPTSQSGNASQAGGIAAQAAVNAAIDGPQAEGA